MGWKRPAPAMAPATKMQKVTTPRPEDDTITALQKLMPKRSLAALKPVAAWLGKECNVTTFADLEGADSYSSEVLALLEVDDSLAIGARGLVKELLKILEGGVSAGGGGQQAAKEDVEEEEAAEEEEDCAEEEDAEEEEQAAPLIKKVTGVLKGGTIKKSAAVSAARAGAASKGGGGSGGGAALLAALKAEKAGQTPFERAFLEQPDELDEEQLAAVEAMREEMEVAVEGDIGRNFSPVTTFEELGVFPEYVHEALAAMNITAPLPIQAQALPIVLGGHDVTGIAKTGSGKTLAYLLPAIVHIEAQEPLQEASVTPIALCLAPTRELVVQIAEEANKLVMKSRNKGNHPGGLWASCIFGGKSKIDQLAKARRGSHIMAATPGRLMDHIQNREVSLSRTTYFVLDEADRMLEEGFAAQLKIIADKVRRDRHMLFFSATWPSEVNNLARAMCQGRRKPVHLKVGQRADGLATTRDSILQEVVVFNQDTWEERDAAKKELLYNHCREVLQEEQNKILVFVSSKVLADELRNQFWKEGFTTDSMHGGRSQDQRLAVLDGFKNGDTRLLVCTDVMGRGLDIPDISHVVIYDMGEVEDYVHRIGRTARGPNGQGHALTLFEFDRKWPDIAAGLIAVLEAADQEVPPDLREIAELAARGEPVLKKQKYSYTVQEEQEPVMLMSDCWDVKKFGFCPRAGSCKWCNL